VTAGLSQHRLADMVGVSQSMVSLVERGRRAVTWSVACALANAAGHDLSLRLYPTRSVSLRDSGQLSLIQGILVAAHPSWHGRLEAPVRAGDPRAADLLLIRPDEILHVEVERTLFDFQAQLRSAELKRSALSAGFEAPVRLVLAIPATRRHRELVSSMRVALSASLSSPSQAIWRAIKMGHPLGRDGLLLLPSRRHDSNVVTTTD
jgi:transcriptional regulator with XRE-family HTH domain